MDNLPPKYPSVVERNFEIYSIVDNPGIRYLRHPSGVIVMTLAESHEMMCKEINEVIWDLTSQKNSKGVDRSKMEVSGKSKKGGLLLMPETRICKISASDGSECVIRAGIKATLVEVNDEYLNVDPNLVRTAANNQGYIAILIPPTSSHGTSLKMPKEFEVIN